MSKTVSSAPTSRLTLAKWMLGIAKPVISPMSLTILFRTLDQLLGVTLLTLGAWGVGKVAENDSSTKIVVLRIAFPMIIIAFLKAFLRYLEQFSGHYVAFRSLEMIRRQFFAKLWPQAPAVLSTQKSGDMLTRATKDIDRLEVFFAHTFPPIITSVLVPILVLITTAIYISPLIAVVMLPFLLLVALIVPFLWRESARKYTTAIAALRAQITQETTDNIQGTAEIIGFNQLTSRLNNLTTLGEQIKTLSKKLIRITVARQVLITILLLTGLTIVTLITGNQVLHHTLNFPQMTCAIAIMLSLFPVVKGAQDVSEDLERAFACADRVYRIVTASPVVKEENNPTPFPPSVKNITFQEVTFDYPGQRAALSSEHTLSNINLEFTGQTRTCIVGRSGSGKSTIGSLLLRFWDPKTGSIKINNLDIRKFSLDDLRKNITIVSQISHLFNLSIIDNLLLANPAASREEIEGACKQAALHEEIMQLPEKYHTIIGEMGEKLSGGQRQRLCLARMFLTPAQVIILDEFTSSLDSINEQFVREAIQKVKPSATIIEITHRLETVKEADQVVVVDKGKIIEQGKPADLLKNVQESQTLLSAIN